MTGRKADNFVQKVKHAAAEHPWYTNASPVVSQSIK